MTEDDFLNAENIIQLGYPPNRIDLLTHIAGVDFESCFGSRNIIEFEGVEMNFISLDDLIKNKISARRLQDLADVEKLKKVKENLNR